MDDLENVILKIIGISEMLDKTKEKLMEYEEAIKNLYYKNIQFRDLTTKLLNVIKKKSNKPQTKKEAGHE